MMIEPLAARPPNALLVWAAVGGATLLLLHRTSFSRAVHAVGNRVRAAHLSGIATRRGTLLCFVIAGACSAAAGVLLTGYSTKAYQAMGDAYQLPAIAAVVLGGTHIREPDSADRHRAQQLAVCGITSRRPTRRRRDEPRALG
jgi:ribose/xylose/arabinose/galactoside ABC-type transport system permease subunit